MMARVAEAYLLGGIALTSEFPLPELPPLKQSDARFPFVDVRLGVTPSMLAEGIDIDPDCQVNSSQFLLRVKGIANYLVSHGEEIVIEPDEHALALDVRAYLLGIVYCVLCHQRGLLPFHASAVATDRGAVAFLARSGEGKSSLAAHLLRRGFSVIADDICLVDSASNGAGGKPIVIPSAPWLKLWRGSLEQLGQPVHQLERVFSEDDKYRLPVTDVLEPQTLHKLVFLEPSGNGRVEIQEAGSARALVSLMNLIHQANLLEAMGKRQEVFPRCCGLLSQAKAYRLTRPWGLEYMEPMVDKVEDFLRSG